MRQSETAGASRTTAAVLAALVAGACWGVSFLAPRALPDVPPATLMFYRFLFFGVSSLLALGIRRGRRPAIDREATRRALELALLGYSAYYALLSLGVQGIGVSFATAIIALLPLTILLAASSRSEWPGLAAPIALIAVGGLLVPLELFGRAYGAFLANDVRLRILGLAATLAALASWTAFAIRNARFLREHPAWRPLDWAGVLGIASMVTGFAIFLAVERGSVVGALARGFGDARLLVWTGFMGVVGAWFTSALWNFASRVLRPAALGMLLVFESVFGLLFGFLYDGRFPSAREGTAAACLIVGAMLGIRRLRAVRPGPRP
ncbi:MAG: DMT family transporter [Bdellovibrionales bacterium]|nr:DMT family transporter [Bdellovibrionales bacterium]